MLKHQHVFEQFIQFENHYKGYLLARREKRYKQEVLQYSSNLEENLINGIEHLKHKSYRITQMREFYEYFPKKRIILAIPFKDRVINCAAYNVLWPIYSRSFYEHSYGSVPGKGTLAAVNQLQYWMKLVENKTDHKWWIAKADVSKFFFRVPVDVQLRELGRPLDDPDMMWFLETAIRGDGRAFGLPLEVGDVAEAERIQGIGMQVGSLISQMTANIVLTPLDHYMKRVVRVPYYIRYMDDMLFLCPSKEQAWDALGKMDEFLRARLGLQLNNKTAVMPYDDGPEFVGRRIWPDRITLRKSTSLRMKRHLRYVREHYATGELTQEYAMSVIVSYLGMMKHCDNDALRRKVLEDFVLVRKSKP
ncbi:MAG: RNA-dependent DNA polymerase [Clostridiales bacterium]|nr:RNA-dependent DNA polymerase [Clostridiales bacterium]